MKIGACDSPAPDRADREILRHNLFDRGEDAAGRLSLYTYYIVQGGNHRVDDKKSFFSTQLLGKQSRQ